VSAYSPSWFRVFGGPVPDERTDAEVAFLTRVLPLPAFRRVLDVPCGHGRHAAALAELGYAVTGVERDPDVAEEARRRAPAAQIVEGDMRALPVAAEHDAVVCMWASFGFWDDATNADVLAQMAGRLRAGGRLVLDVFDRRFFEPRLGQRERDVNGLRVRERHTIRGRRLYVELEYEDSDDRDAFEWRLYEPHELADLAPGFRAVVLCHDWDDDEAPDGSRPRYQLVLELPG
jgi:SAM-dependent methyltransferase